MMRSMYSGVSGLKVHQTKMDVIGNNISNVNTVGFKAQRVTFSDVFSQTISGSSSASDDTGRGGTNAKQVGIGVGVSSIDMLMTTGSAQRTDNPFDVMVNGDGFIIVGDATGQYFTKNGAFRLDGEGNLCIANGMKVQGWLSSYNDDTNAYEINASEVTTINLHTTDIQSAKATATTKATVTGNLCSTTEKDSSYAISVPLYDSLGNFYSIAMNLTKGDVDTQGETTWKLEPVKMNGDAVVATDSKGNEIELPGFTLDITEIKFDSDGKILKDTSTIMMGFGGKTDEGNKTPTVAGSTVSTVQIDLSGLTQYATANTAVAKTTNGNAAGTLSGYSIGSDGIITATYSNGDVRQVAQVVLAEFDNAAGLEKIGDNLYTITNNSGEFDGVGLVGSFNTGVLEMSNVDLSTEFTEMIITQRGYQANSRVITVSDELLQELTNLKR